MVSGNIYIINRLVNDCSSNGDVRVLRSTSTTQYLGANYYWYDVPATANFFGFTSDQSGWNGSFWAVPTILGQGLSSVNVCNGAWAQRI